MQILARRSRCSGSPIRVLVIEPGGQGGITRLFDVVRAELAVRPLGDIDLRFLTTRGRVPGLVGALTTTPFIFAMAMVRQVALMVVGRVDVVHINLASYGSTYRKLVSAKCAAMFRVPYVIHLHGGGFKAFWLSRSPFMARRIEKMLQRAARIVVLGDFWRDVIADRMPQCAAAVVTLPNAVPPGRRQETDDAGQPVRILFLGRLGARKGVKELVEALGLLGANPAWTATIAGDGAVAGTRSEVERLGLSSRTKVPGWLGDADARRALQSADILALPSHVENLPMAVIEAFAHGLAVVTTPVGEIADIVEHGRTGLLVPPGDTPALAEALRTLIDDPALRRRLGESAKAFHEEHLQVDSYVRRLGEIWRAAARQEVGRR